MDSFARVVRLAVVPTALLAGTALPAGHAATPGGSPAGQERPAIEEWREELRATEGVWLTSNAGYEEEDGGIDRFGMSFRVQPGGLSATGCLWSERAGEVEAIVWRFFQGWDPSREAGMLYQAHPSGMVGFGHFRPGGEGPGLVQDFRTPDGSGFRAGHYEERPDPDTRVSRSVDWTDGAWTPRRSYIWKRGAASDDACVR